METPVFQKAPTVDERDIDWAYTMRREMQEIVPNVFLGPYASAMKSKLESLKNAGITHIICVRQSIEANFIKPNFPNDFQYLLVEIADTITENIIQHFPRVKTFIDIGLQLGGKVLVHGNAGISRSGALVIAYIMEQYGMTYKQALQYVQQRRFCISPNEGFAQQLREYEPIYLARAMSADTQNELTNLINWNKRKMEEESDIIGVGAAAPSDGGEERQDNGDRGDENGAGGDDVML